MAIPVVSIIVNTFDRPWHLARCLRSIEIQAFEMSQVEIVVVDDGSEGSKTFDTVSAFAKRSDLRTIFLSHPKNGFRLAMCRNKAASVVSAESIVFLDGDCIVPNDFLSQMLKRLESKVTIACDSYRLSEAASDQVTFDSIDCWSIPSLVSRKEMRRMSWKALRAVTYQTLNVPMRPRLTGCAFAMMKSDLKRVNGFDENFVGWGLEDRDLQRRLEGCRVRIKTALHRMKAVHLWHPVDPTFSKNCVGRANRTYYDRESVPSYCEQGLDQYSVCRPPHTIFSPRNPIESLASEIHDLKLLMETPDGLAVAPDRSLNDRISLHAREH